MTEWSAWQEVIFGLFILIFVWVSNLTIGLPHPSLFPFQELNLSSYSSSTVLDALSPDHVPKKLDQISVSRGATEESPLSLNQALQYGQSHLFHVVYHVF
jgi:hypothetical protein